MHPRMNGTKRHAFRETRSVLCHSLVVDSTERGCHHRSGEFEQLLLTCIKGSGLRNNTNRFKVRAATRTVLTIDFCTAREMRLCEL